jgi:hypothetical protein
MKTRSVILVCLFIFLSSLTSTAQDSAKSSVFSNMYLRVGFEMTAFNNVSGYSKLTENVLFFGSVSYDYNEHIQLDIMYRHMNDLVRTLDWYFAGTVLGSHGYDHFQAFSSNLISAKVNYFISSKRELNPFYATGGISIAIQPVHDRLVDFYPSQGPHGSTIQNIDVIDIRSYTRMMLGPEFGVGMFLAFGRVNFQSEITYSARFSTFTDTNYRELSFSLFNGLVYKF